MRLLIAGVPKAESSGGSRRRTPSGPSAFVALALVAAVISACGDSDGSATPPTDTAASAATAAAGTSPVAQAAGAITVKLHEENGSGQTGTATITPAGGGIDVDVQVDDQDIGQLALITGGACEKQGVPFSTLAGLTYDGDFARVSGAVRLEDGKPITTGELQAGNYAVVVVDAAYREGPLAEIPPSAKLLNTQDPEGPYGDAPSVLAACGDIPAPR